MYFYIQCSVIGQLVCVVDDKIISSTVAPVNCKESDERVRLYLLHSLSLVQRTLDWLQRVLEETGLQRVLLV